ncbi:MAG: putative 2OG-Fe(II) oxygenase [Gammaproteobacteria bacterium]|nr:putative 2OG-Fe(II) oxygenase [Gammaproteobacteria bacterium]MDH3750610.1 putative 2OG-Fe(II) oxygenase [Gammaproteobacteria bacterium]MDH3803929.1 putative 2OG-Fe(II) oxygenase [Gammaproteobacteria bacterium]
MANSLQSLFDRAVALKGRGKLTEAIELYTRATKEYPNSAVAEHNLAAAFGDAGRASEAEAHIQRAFAKGLSAPESWLVFARALSMQGKLDEAHDAFVKTLELNPAVLDAHRELAQLTWMMTGDSAAALSALESAMRSFPDVVALHTIKAQVLRFTVSPAAAYRFIITSLERWPNEASLLSPAIDWATHAGEPEAALAMSERLVALQPDTQSARGLHAIALLASGRADEALPIVEAIVMENPEDQHSLALLATACRILGDDRYAELYDYDQFVRPYELTAPRGWSSLSEYLADLGEGLRARHPFKTHPFSNSVDGGSMISGLLGMDEPAIRALPQAIAPAIDAHMARLGTGSDPLRSRNAEHWKINGIWSVWLKPNGFHHDHVHPSGWLSSACYVELPEQLDEGAQQGWIKFGEPGIVTSPRLLPEHTVKPRPGTIVLFPSYMWHGTVPFGGDSPRLTVALDIVPD